MNTPETQSGGSLKPVGSASPTGWLRRNARETLRAMRYERERLAAEKAAVESRIAAIDAGIDLIDRLLPNDQHQR